MNDRSLKDESKSWGIYVFWPGIKVACAWIKLGGTSQERGDQVWQWQWKDVLLDCKYILVNVSLYIYVAM